MNARWKSNNRWYLFSVITPKANAYWSRVFKLSVGLKPFHDLMAALEIDRDGQAWGNAEICILCD